MDASEDLRTAPLPEASVRFEDEPDLAAGSSPVRVSATPSPVHDPLVAVLEGLRQDPKDGGEENDDDEKPEQPANEVRSFRPIPSDEGASHDQEHKRLVQKVELIDKLAESEHKRKRRMAEEARATADSMARAVKFKSYKDEQTLPGEGDPAAYNRVWRQYQRYRDELGAVGSGKRLTYGVTKFTLVTAEVESMRRQVNEKRGNNVFDTVIDMLFGAAEKVSQRSIHPSRLDLSGLAEEWTKMKKEDKALQTALAQINIEYGHIFALGPESVLCQKAFELITIVNEKNQAKRDDKRQGEAPAGLAEFEDEI